jgi:hypothetical protein
MEVVSKMRTIKKKLDDDEALFIIWSLPTRTTLPVWREPL